MLNALKQFIILFLVLFYSASASGFGIKAHYCHGKLVSISFNALEESKCCCAKKKMPSKCCDTKKLEVKANDSHLKTNDVSVSKVFSSFFAHISHNIFHTPVKFFGSLVSCLSSFSQRKYFPDIIILISVLRI
jgi:hypothetical protein